MKKLHRRLLIWLMVFIIFIGWLVFSTPILLKVNDIANVQNVDATLYPAKNTVRFSYAAPEILNDFFHTVFLRGYAYVSTQGSSTNRKVSLLLQSRTSGELYEVDCIINSGEGFDGFLITNKNTWQKRFPEDIIPEEQVGFVAYFSTLNLPDDVYDTFIYCAENEINYGIADIGVVFEKKNKQFKNVDWTSKSIAIPSQIAGDQLPVFWLDQIEINAENIEAYGWSFVQGETTEAQKAFLRFHNPETGEVKVYSSLQSTRMDIANRFGNSIYQMCGMNLTIPKEEISNGIWEVSSIIETQENCCQSVIWEIEVSDKKIDVLQYGSMQSLMLDMNVYDFTTQDIRTFCVPPVKLSHEDTSVFVRGYTYVPLSAAGKDRKAFLLLRNKQTSRTYSVNCITEYGYGYDGFMFVNLGEIQSQYPDDTIPDGNIAFATTFSTENIDEGEYDLYIGCVENEKDFGIKKTEYSIKKTASGIDVVKP